MTVTLENQVIAPAQNDKVDSNLTQIKVDTNLTHENKNSSNPGADSNGEVSGDPNWKAFREARKKDKEQREAAEKRAAEKEAEATALKAAMEAAFSKSAPTIQQNGYQNDQVEETEDEKIDRRVNTIIAAREAATEKARIEREKADLPNRLQATYSDYYQVVNEENGAYLEYHHPEIYRALLRQPENFESCSDIYKAVKKLIPNSTTAKKEATRADNNFSKPRSISSTGLTQNTEGATSIRLSDDRKAANWARMQTTLKGVS